MAKGKKTGGRSAGVPNKQTADVKALAGQYTEAAIKRLAHLALHAQSEAAQVAACKELLDRRWGRPSQAITGPDGEALKVPQSIVFQIVAQADAVCQP